MTEFDTYLQLGNELETENKMLMAFSAYLEAIKKAGEGQKQIIENYLKLLVGKIKKDNKERNQELKEQLLKWKDEGKVSVAISSYENIYNHMEGVRWIDYENAILNICLNIYQMEEKYSTISLDIKRKGMEELKKWYYSLKFMVRRVDMDIYDEEEIAEFIKRENISMVTLNYMCMEYCIHIGRTYWNFVKMFKKYSMEDYALFFEELCEGKNQDESIVPDGTLYEYKGEEKEKIAFIMAVNEEAMYEEALYYINHLKVPENMEIEVVPIRGAKSAASAYNMGMKQTDAKYKVYMHQDVMIINPYMIYEVVNIFKNRKIGLIGVAGTKRMPDDGVWWSDKNEIYWKIYQDSVLYRGFSYSGNFSGEYEVVDAIDGVMMITQYDVLWREDNFKGWHFYDISQSMEFHKINLEVVVAAQKQVWCLHEQKCNKEYWEDYDRDKEKFLCEYKK